MLHPDEHFAHEIVICLANRYTILHQTEATWPILNRPTIKNVTYI